MPGMRRALSAYVCAIILMTAGFSGCGRSSADLEKFSLDETYSRYYSETTSELKPSQSYGEIYPYIGGTTDSYFAVNPYIFGFCDLKGSIICDPSYVDMKLFEYQGKKVYVFSKASGKMSEGEMLLKMYVAANDGSFVMEFEKVFDGHEGTLTVRKDGKWGSVDYDGNEIIPCVYAYPLLFGDGLAAVSEDYSRGYKYVDKQNKIIISQVPPIPESEVSKRVFVDFDTDMDDAYLRMFEELVFQDGRAPFFEGVKYGYINESGETAIPAVFDADMVWSFKFSGGAVIASVDKKYALIDKKGAEILPAGNYDIYRQDDVFRVYDKDNGKYWVADSGGNIIIEPYASDITYEYVGNGWFYKTTDYMECDLVKDGVVYPVAVSSDIQLVGEDRFLVRYFEESGSVCKIIDSSGNVYFDGGADLRLSYIDAQNLISVIRNDSWLFGLIDAEGNYVLEADYRAIFPVYDKFAVCQGFYGGLIDESGNWVIKVSLLDYIND